MKKLVIALFILCTATTLVYANSQTTGKQVDTWVYEINYGDWKINNNIQTPEGAMYDLIPKSEDFDNWTKSLIHQVTFGQEDLVNIEKQFEIMAKDKPSEYTYELIEKDENNLVFVFVSQKTKDFESSWEIKRFKNGHAGLYSITYKERTSRIDNITKAKWINEIQNAKLEMQFSKEGK